MTSLAPISSNTTRSTTAHDAVTELPGLGKVATQQFAGYASITGDAYPKTRSGYAESLFYWFVGADDYANKPTIIWSNGGPGSSSFWGFFLENGPYHIESASEPKLTERPHAWNQHANYLIFEHPLSVMLSFAKSAKDLPQTPEEGAQQYYQALQNFLSLHPEVAKNPIILAGESYAGTYLPLLAREIKRGNKHEHNIQINLKSMVLMDAWVEPYAQMSMDTEYAYSHGMISRREKQKLDKEYKHNYPALNAAIQSICGLYMTNIAELADPPFQPIMDYLNRKDVRAALHIHSDIPLTESWSAAIANNYQADVNKSVRKLVNKLIDQGLQTIVISGLNDAKDCNFMGTEKWLHKLKGHHAETFKDAATQPWRLSAQSPVLGYVQGDQTLTWLKVLNAGHMAAMDQPNIINWLKDRIGF